MIELLQPVNFIWNKGNQEKSWIKHQVLQKEVEEVFFNRPLRVISDLSHSSVEKRYFAYGQTNLMRELTVVFTIRNSQIRVISTRHLNKRERREYEKSQEN